MIIKNAKIVDDAFRLRQADIEIDNGIIVKVEDDISYTDKDIVIDSSRVYRRAYSRMRRM